MLLALVRWRGPWRILLGTGHRTRKIVVAAVFPTSVDRLTWLTPITMVDAMQVFTISNRYRHPLQKL